MGKYSWTAQHADSVDCGLHLWLLIISHNVWDILQENLFDSYPIFPC